MMIGAAVKVRAMQKATTIAKDSVRRAGHRWPAYSAAEKKALAQLVLTASPQLITEARTEVEQWTLAGAFGKRMQKAMVAAQQATAQLA